MSPPFLKAGKIADALGLEWRDGAWSGRIDGLKVRVEGGDVRDSPEYARIVVSLPRSLRLGCLACTGPQLRAPETVQAIPFGHHRLDTFLVLAAAETEVARAILCACADDIIALQGAGLTIDDRTIALTEHAFYSAEVFAEQAPAMVALARRLVRERGDWEACFETAIAPLWSRLAAEAEMAWDADRSRISGEVYGARIDAQVTSEVGALAVRFRSRWPSLGRSIGFDWEGGRPTEVPEWKRPREWPISEPLSYEATYATRLIASTGAALSLDDDGAVARLPDLHRARRDHDVHMERVFHAMLTLTRELLAPSSLGGGGLYR